MILVHDDFFKTDLSTLIAKGTEVYEWRCWRPVIDDSANNMTFVSYLWTESADDNFYCMLWKMIQNKIEDLKDFYCFRIIANGMLKGQKIIWHTDKGDKTVLYFPLAWSQEWGGSIYFKIGSGKREIQYRQNRLIIFDSDLEHYGSSPAIDNIFRISIAFNLHRKTAELTKTT